MRRKVELWIGSLRADLADDSFILMNYTMEDLTSPAVVRNSFSKQITLPGTSANNQIFGEIFRSDRVTQYGGGETGRYFDPTRKTSWRLYNERSELIESGYLRLDTINRRRNVIVEYKVTLFGGLGSFLYGLSYDENGEKRTLAGLEYLNTGTPATELNFTLNAAAVKAAWQRIAAASGAPSQKWDVINFAPCYNGKPSGTFDAGKGLLDVVAAGIQPTAVGTVGGIALVNLSQEYTEWETKDLRSYLQRPVVRLRSVIEAACASRNNGGWSVLLDGQFFNEENPYWQKTWMTLPIIDTDNIVNDNSGSGSLTWSQVGGDPSIVEATIPNADNNLDYTVDVRIRPVVQFAASQSGTLYLHCDDSGTSYMSYVQYLINAYDANNTLVASTALRVSSRQPAAEAGDVPQMDAVNTFSASGTSGSWNGSQLSAVVSGRGISRVRVTATTVALKWGTTTANTPDGNAMWTNNQSYASLVSASKYYGDFGGGTYSWSALNGGRSGKNITKEDVLSGGGTPGDYLLAFCKTFGLVIVADGATKTVKIEKRTSFYGSEVVDIQERIDTDTGYEKTPFAFSAKWYVWSTQYEKGEWAKVYEEKYGRVFGQQRVDTGYGFDANTTKVLDGVIFRGAVMALECEKYFCSIVENGRPLPSVLLDRGAKYSVVESATTTKDVEINLPSSAAVITWMNAANPSYDLFPKAQFHEKDNAAFDERDTLLFFDGMTASGSPFTITDDTAAMMTLNEGTPCWLLQWTTVDAGCAAPPLPKFSRYLDYTSQHQGYVYERSLDFGTPSEVPIPSITFRDGATIWAAYFERYIADRYDDDSAVVRCKVNLAGMQVGPDLFRRFYWFDGAVWALNRIINHSVTTYDLTDCEFVKVQDIANYKS